ncbi:MAG: TolC family protein [Phaeodactylibacter sp.]|uniref:TolC family protein n=1 Tax=Phaeodactylibacter sp. TaxID=1940289 RepID=UPI0032EC4F39
MKTKSSLLLLLPICLMLQVLPVSPLTGQSRFPVTLDEAMAIARRNYPELRRDQKALEQLQALRGTARPNNPTQLFFAGGMVDPSNLSTGLHSAGFFKAFDWPGATQLREQALEEAMLLGNAQLELTDWELRQEVARAYYQLVFTKSLQLHYQEKQELTSRLVEYALARYEFGETGKIPVLSANSKQKQASLEQQEAQKAYDLAHTIFNNYLHSDSVFYALLDSLPLPSPTPNWYVNGGHPQLLKKQQEVRLAEAQIERERSQLMPKILAGTQLQMINETVPFVGYQLGLSVPISPKAIQSRIEGAEKAVAVREAELDATERALENRRRELTTLLLSQKKLLEYTQKEMLPLANEQIQSAEAAYKSGAVGYHDYLVNLEQGLQTKLEWIHNLSTYHQLRLQLEFLSGRQ